MQQELVSTGIIKELRKISNREAETKDKSYLKKRIMDGDIKEDTFLFNLGGIYVQSKKPEVFQQLSFETR